MKLLFAIIALSLSGCGAHLPSTHVLGMKDAKELIETPRPSPKQGTPIEKTPRPNPDF